jgi:hypothetical protein
MKMAWHRVACALLLVAALVAIPQTVLAQQGLTPVTGGGLGRYVGAAPTELQGALDKLTAELDAVPLDATPEQIRAATFRRRILELRLLMDLNSFAYERPKLNEFRADIDAPYEAVGRYQDLPMIQKALGTDLDPQVIQNYRTEMNDALGPLRDQGIRAAMREFFAHPLASVRSKQGGPGLWDISGTRAAEAFDATGNAALMESGIVNELQGSDIGVVDIFDPSQETQLHLVRKRLRSVLLLATLFPATGDAIQDVRKPLDDLVSAYGDVNDAYTIYTFARNSGMNADEVANTVRDDFAHAQAVKDQVVQTHALDALAIALNSVRDSHRH